MSVAIDTSVVIASLDPDEPHHAACDRLLARGGLEMYVHALAEAFAVLTGGGHRRRIRAADAAALLRDNVVPYVRLHALSGKEHMKALLECEERGVRGGAIYDFLHLAAARKAGAERFVTLDLGNLRALRRAADPSVDLP